MALEAVNGAISYQAQTQQTQAPVKPEMDLTDETVTSIPQVDDTTAKVANTSEGKESDANSDTQPPTLEQMKKAIDMINKKANNSIVQFGVHEATNRITVKIVDKDTKKVIREVPAEKTLDMIAKAWEMAGILIDEKR